MDKLFEIDQQAREQGLSREARHALRLEEAQPLLEVVSTFLCVDLWIGFVSTPRLLRLGFLHVSENPVPRTERNRSKRFPEPRIGDSGEAGDIQVLAPDD